MVGLTHVGVKIRCQRKLLSHSTLTIRNTTDIFKHFYTSFLSSCIWSVLVFMSELLSITSRSQWWHCHTDQTQHWTRSACSSVFSSCSLIEPDNFYTNNVLTFNIIYGRHCFFFLLLLADVMGCGPGSLFHNCSSELCLTTQWFVWTEQSRKRTSFLYFTL